jgi:hypothetical protein
MIDPRGILRNVVTITETPSATLILMECGHTGSFAQHFHYDAKDQRRCVQCLPNYEEMLKTRQ